ncbi:uncharacterized protein K452DRAFT_232137 [Aplosporella prunicola CBS 121167]|uniref:Major facilitator superfamily (MFS) profile domain-containing protein n=1 Tax=Aplosporella prunicola CBS 121167 TaxID=1176127 RepID=A0A6A6B8L7_9PEZI|nr:uncharacterized protein K452DRAFT_232137 [Aplosporella prunicola CBS 121167]KAF2139703.1 hypothetical protein K452DRAFT_232137 [Aplosporella prunicola CBS 121167]
MSASPPPTDDKPALHNTLTSPPPSLKDKDKENLSTTIPLSPTPTSASLTAGTVSDPTAPHPNETRLALKFDTRLLPLLALMYLCNALDKGNLGNAKTAGLENDLHLKPGQYNTLLSVFFVPYVVFAPPIAFVGKRLGPAVVLPVLMACFGSMTLVGAAVKGFGGLMAVRWFLGMAESAFFPLVIYYLTTFYRRAELARRLALFYAASNIANAFSGLLAFGVFQINSSLQRWRYLFIIEGAATVLFSLLAFLYLPRTARSARFLSPGERALAHRRIQQDSSAIVNEPFDLRSALRIFAHPTTYAFLVLELCVGVPLQSVALFLPQIIARLSPASAVHTNLLTVAPNAVGALVLLLLAFASDLARCRAPFIALGFSLTCAGFAAYAAMDATAHPRAAYFACFLMTWGTAAPSVLLSTWYSNNVAHEGRRVALTSVGVPLANLMGLVSSNVFRERDAPGYLPALATTAGFGALGALVALGLGAFMRWDNGRRDRREGVRRRVRDVSTERLRDGPWGSEFRWFL